jgi:hypothetical protein
MKKFIESLQVILPFMKNPDVYAPCQCEHDVLYIWGVDFTKMNSEDVKKIVEFGFNPGFEQCDFIRECFGNEDYAWKDLTEEIWNKMKNSLSDCLYSFKYGSC